MSEALPPALYDTADALLQLLRDTHRNTVEQLRIADIQQRWGSRLYAPTDAEISAAIRLNTKVANETRILLARAGLTLYANNLPVANIGYEPNPPEGPDYFMQVGDVGQVPFSQAELNFRSSNGQHAPVAFPPHRPGPISLQQPSIVPLPIVTEFLQ